MAAVRLLGPVEMSVAGQPLALGAPKQRALLALLALRTGSAVSMDQLIEALWTEPPPTATKMVQLYVSRLRRLLVESADAATIETHGRGYELRIDGDAVDALRAERLIERAGASAGPDRGDMAREALTLWRGRALTDLDDEPFAVAETRRLEELRLRAEELVIESQLDAGLHAQVIGPLERLVAEQPLRERFHAQRMLALYRCGRQADALDAFHAARRVLVEQIGIEPGPELRELHSAVLAQDPRLDVSARHPGAAGDPGLAGARFAPPEPAPQRTGQDQRKPVAARARSTVATPLLEREAEVTLLTDAVDGVMAGAGRLLVVEGPAGIGKTSLLAAGRHLARQRGMTVLTARGVQLEREFGFGVVRQLFEQLLVKRGADSLRGAASLAAPALGFDAAADAPSPADLGFSILHGLYWLVVDLAAESPVALVVDDAQWSDAPTLRFLAYLAVRLEALPVLLAVGVRSPEVDDDRADLAALTADPQTIVIRPGELGHAAVRAALVERFGEPVLDEFVTAVERATGGNPLLVTELAAALRADGVDPATAAARVAGVGPAAIVGRLLRRLVGLPGGALSLARAAAICGERADRRDVGRLAGLEPDALERAARSLVGAGVLAEGPGLVFRHPVIRQAVYSDIAPFAREELHARAARILAERAAAPEDVALQLLAIAPRADEQAAEILRAAAREAAARGAPDIAARYLRRALGDTVRGRDGELLAELGEVEALAGEPAAAGHLTEALERLPDAPARARVALQLSGYCTLAGDFGRATEVALQAVSDLGDGDRDLRLAFEALLLTLEIATGHPTPVPPTDAQHLSGATPAERALLAAMSLRAATRGEPLRSVLDMVDRALASGDLLAESANGPSFNHAINALLLCGHFDRATGLIQRSIEKGLIHGAVRNTAGALAVLAFAQLRRGAVKDAAGNAALALEQLATHDIPLSLYGALGFLVEALVERGELDAASDALHDHQATGCLPEHRAADLTLVARARLRAAQGRLDDALADLLEAGRRLEPAGVVAPVMWPWRSCAVELLVKLDDRPSAEQLAREERASAERSGSPYALALAARSQALVAGPERAIALLEEAVEHLSTSECRLEHARALIELGAALRRAGRLDASAERLQQGRALARRCGALALEAQAITLGAGPDGSPERTALEALAPSEWQVARLTADGMEPNEIAQSLFVTPETVKARLSAVFRKLGVESRDELRRALDDGETTDLSIPSGLA